MSKRHYTRPSKDVPMPGPKPRPVAERFWEKVDRSGDCWIWKAFIRPNGYGDFGFEKNKTTRAHRVSWILTFGEIPDGLLVCHFCDVRACVRPDHLFLGNHFDNMMDAIKKGRRCTGVGFRSTAGELNPTSKLCDDEVREILRRVANGEPQNAIAKALKVAPKTINNIVYGKTWKHVGRIVRLGHGRYVQDPDAPIQVVE